MSILKSHPRWDHLAQGGVGGDLDAARRARVGQLGHDEVDGHAVLGLRNPPVF